MPGSMSRSVESIRSTRSTETNETSELLSNELSNPRRSSPPPYSVLFGTNGPSTAPVPTYSYTGINAPKDGGPPSPRLGRGGDGYLAPDHHLRTPPRNPSRPMDPTLARRASISLSPQLRGRRLSNASLVRSRSIADLADGEGSFSRDRILALLCVCTLSIGSHFTSNILGPIKSQLHRELGSNNSQFSLLISALSLNSTWTPLVGGILVSRFGTAWSSVVCTGLVLLGEIILYAGTMHHSLTTMASGLFLFGMGVSPLAVVQETLLARLSPGGHLGLSLALGLVSGKSASFMSALISKPLAEHGGSGLPFFVALLLCAGSFAANLARLAFNWGETRTRHEHVHTKRIVKWDGLSRLGDVFYLFIAVNMLCGMIWSPFMHLSANIIQVRFNLNEETAAIQASVLLSGAMLLYPIVGHITDRHGSTTPRTTFQMFFITTALTLLGYIALSLPVSIVRSAWPGLIPWALGHGASPLLLVVIVARILPVDLVPLGLGMHKAMETAASTGFQTLAGLYLDYVKGQATDGDGDDDEAGEAAANHSLLIIFAALNVLQLIGAIVLWRVEARRRHSLLHQMNPIEETATYVRAPSEERSALGLNLHRDEDNDSGSDVDSLLGAALELLDADEEPQSGLARNDAERTRARVSFKLCLLFIAAVWILFIATAWARLR